MSTPLPQLPAQVQMPLSERTSRPESEETKAPTSWGALGRFGIPVLALAIVLGFVTVAITRGSVGGSWCKDICAPIDCAGFRERTKNSC